MPGGQIDKTDKYGLILSQCQMSSAPTWLLEDGGVAGQKWGAQEDQ